jgi:WH2 motif
MASSELLKQIQAGRKLKSTETNDRSAPIVDTPKVSRGPSGLSGSSGTPLPSGGGPPQLAGLFAGGMPKLKSAGQPKLGMFICTR